MRSADFLHSVNPSNFAAVNDFKKIHFHTLGCKLNFSETSGIARTFQEAGYARVELEERPDVVVINTCSVTEQADKKCRNIVARAIRHNPGVFVAVVGCYAQLKPDEIASIPGVRLVLGAGEKFNLLQHVQESENTTVTVQTGEIRDVKDFIPSFSSGDRTRTFLKVQDGCNYFCAFCTIPLARGRSRSANVAQTMLEVQRAIDGGAQEIVLTGVNIGDFGTAHGENLLQLIQAIEDTPSETRFRISSIEPNLLTNEIIEFVARSKRFMPHFHIPLQSGSDEVLRAMRRRYRTDLYRDRITTIRTLMPHACIGVDVITGFRNETEELFLETKDFLMSLPISYLHVFTYSERDDTTALRIQERVPVGERHRRTQVLRMLSEKMKRGFYDQFVGSARPVLWEQAEDEGLMHGFTDNYIKVTMPYDDQLVNRTSHTKLTGRFDDESLRGETV
jgi:threonylcarbamoyladenosine tRNA methylthiotransferase MtaB